MQVGKVIGVSLINKETGEIVAEWQVKEDIDAWVKMDSKQVKVGREDWEEFVKKVDRVKRCSKDDFMRKYLEWESRGLK